MESGINYFIWFVFYSMIGWFYETTLYMFSEKRFVDKSFLQGPFCPVYGLGAISMILFLEPFKNNILLLFLLGSIIACTVEYLTAYFLDKSFNHKEWDYSWRKFNLHGRICILGAIVFGVFAVLLIKYVHPVVLTFTNLVPQGILWFICISLLIIQVSDFIITFRKLIMQNSP